MAGTNIFQTAYRRMASWRLSSGLRFGFTGSRISRIPASDGVRPPLCVLHVRQAQTTFSQVSGPPRLRGITWSRLSRCEANRRPQY